MAQRRRGSCSTSFPNLLITVTSATAKLSSVASVPGGEEDGIYDLASVPSCSDHGGSSAFVRSMTSKSKRLLGSPGVAGVVFG